MSEKEQPRLASALAQKVVDTIAPTINRHVNIMNAHGIIIASSDASRVGTLHEGSVQVIRRNEIIRVTQADESAGTQPGVNLPLRLNDQLCGVVGVTGAPHEVEPLADLIALTVQLLFAQEREHSHSARKAAEARDIISALLAGHVAAEVIERTLETHGLRAPWQLELWIPRSEQDPELEQPALDGIRTAWVGLFGAHWRLRKAGGEAVDAPKANDRYLVGPEASDAGELLAQAEVLRTLVARPALLPQHGHQAIWNQDIAVAVARAPARSLKYLALKAQVLNQEQAKTLLVVVAASSMSEAAESLHIHRNTLVQRLERIGQVTGVEIRQAAESLRLQHAVYARIALDELRIF
ncbi:MULTISPECIES: sugar diacid recognition domain-containing protein [Micrococcaceae]|uniref:sugar diacid recognition domain-containing protein n=1 Tax=Micrococcaceae TaxID=1268 RepID=UPI001036AABF|nr:MULTISPECIES: sugar diacid recognition domain-containing protein [Micrococcaceae]TAP28590.1 sugar diacid recognition family protein [Arthrobacter sp. S41]UXN32582.1 helix-turn-helix domain-containing protein [Glutamicibacter sp. M10]